MVSASQRVTARFRSHQRHFLCHVRSWFSCQQKRTLVIVSSKLGSVLLTGLGTTSHPSPSPSGQPPFLTLHHGFVSGTLGRACLVVDSCSFASSVLCRLITSFLPPCWRNSHPKKLHFMISLNVFRTKAIPSCKVVVSRRCFLPFHCAWPECGSSALIQGNIFQAKVRKLNKLRSLF